MPVAFVDGGELAALVQAQERDRRFGDRVFSTSFNDKRAVKRSVSPNVARLHRDRASTAVTGLIRADRVISAAILGGLAARQEDA